VFGYFVVICFICVGLLVGGGVCWCRCVGVGV
jgi:hypothetical protein